MRWLLFLVMGVAVSGTVAEPGADWQLVIHGGAGGISRESLSVEREGQMRATLERALQAGSAVLAGGGSSVAAVQAAIVVLEDSPLFNAGKGAVFNAAGANELDASIMRGEDLEAGAVAGVTRIRNPVLAAHAVMVASPHVMLAGSGAEQFAAEIFPLFGIHKRLFFGWPIITRYFCRHFPALLHRVLKRRGVY